MRVQVEAEDQGTTGRKVPMTFEEIGSQAWVRIEIDGQQYDVDYREFWQAARSVCLNREE